MKSPFLSALSLLLLIVSTSRVVAAEKTPAAGSITTNVAPGAKSTGSESPPANGAKIVSVAKIWDEGKHNAFTDLARFKGQWYCTFREALGHVGGDGKIRVLRSDDGKAWTSVALIEETGIDLRDPKLSETPDGRLMLVLGGSVYEGGKVLKGRQPRVSFSTDGVKWTAPEKVLAEGDWLWRVTWHKGKAYGVSYTTGEKGGEWATWLYMSDDGLKYTLLKKLDVTEKPNEATVRFLPDDEMVVMVRREGGKQRGWIGASEPPYQEWKWNETKVKFGGPNFIQLENGELWGTSRTYYDKDKTGFGRMTKDSFEPTLILPSGGDTSYAGMVEHEGKVWVSYYASHEGKSAIYLAVIETP